ncbi:unnamed protein product [Symbiodinium microadriaticum]|nr:unnamed protein product [Symbiodinium microadriaticum]
MLMDINHKAVEEMHRKLCLLRQEYVESKQKNIIFGNGTTWADVEADEATFDRRDISNDSQWKHLVKTKDATMLWEQWAGVVQRGKPETLALFRLAPKLTVKRAPGPGAIRKLEWKTLGNKLLHNRRIVLHTDSAKSYKLKIEGVIHDRVVHAKKRVKVDGKFRWLKPHYVKLVKHKVPNTNRTITVKSGTQIIDRAWRFLKDRIIVNQNCRAGSKALRAKLRSAQYEYWHKNDDLWLHCGVLCNRRIKKLVSA